MATKKKATRSKKSDIVASVSKAAAGRPDLDGMTKPNVSDMVRALGITPPTSKVSSVQKTTPEQEAVIERWSKAWRDIGLSTEPADRLRVERGLVKCREFAKVAKADAPVVWAPDPISTPRGGIIAAAIIENWDEVKGEIAPQGGAFLPEDLTSVDVTRRVLRAVLGPREDDYVGQLYALYVGKHKDYAREEVRTLWYKFLGGQFTAAWCGAERFWAEVCGLEVVENGENLTERGKWYAELTHGGKLWLHEDFSVVSERPTAIKLNASGVLHCETGPALAWGKDLEIYVLEGTEVPAEWITHKAQVDPSLVFTHPNVEQRRVLRNHLGWEKILTKFPVKSVDMHFDATVGELLEVELPELGRRRFLRMLCATGRTMIEQVDPDCQTAWGAQAWRQHKTAEEYVHPVVQT